MYHNLASLNEHAEKLCESGRVISAGIVCLEVFAHPCGNPLWGTNSRKEQGMKNKWCSNNPFDHISANPTWKPSLCEVWRRFGRTNWKRATQSHSEPAKFRKNKKTNGEEGHTNDGATMPATFSPPRGWKMWSQQKGAARVPELSQLTGELQEFSHYGTKQRQNNVWPTYFCRVLWNHFLNGALTCARNKYVNIFPQEVCFEWKHFSC